MSAASKRLEKKHCIDLRGRLVDLGYGQADSESEDSFARRLYPVREHLRALDPEVVLVVGPRGSGKTQMFKAFFSSNRDLADGCRLDAGDEFRVGGSEFLTVESRVSGWDGVPRHPRARQERALR